MTTQAVRPVVAVIGIGGMGRAIARRLGAGKSLLIADFNEQALGVLAEELTGDGFDVTAQVVDVSKADSMRDLAAKAASLGPVMQVAHTAGLSPTQAPAAAIMAVDLVGVANMLDAFGEVVAPAGAGVVIASMAGSMAVGTLTREQEKALASTPSAELLSLPFVSPDNVTDGGAAYSLAKRANQIRVEAMSGKWGERGARVNSISPGIISTPMGRQELDGESGAGMRAMIAGSGTGRLGTPEDIVAAAAFLLGPDASFITGTDLLVDGGVVSSIHFGSMSR